ncbi:MAG: hypothetical protein Q8M54_03055 [Desulfobaccales bacterium]|nr:hypothetical protein [Desulfobaccales bacterium]
MNKKTLLFLAIMALVALPTMAMGAVSAPTTPGAVEFSLGGYIKMEADWDSTQVNKNMVSPVLRNNDPSYQHGRLKLTANSSRFNFTFKGPKVFGAQITGFLEFDCDANGAAVAQADTATAFRMRHAFFRLNWPETELLMGQYFGMFSEFCPELANDGANQNTGSAVQRPPQIRLTQKFLGAYTIAAALVAPTNVYDSSTAAAVFQSTNTASANGAVGWVTNLPGETSETPQLQAKVAYEKDLWGKAAFYGTPRGFVAQVAYAWQRTRYRPFVLGAGHITFGDNGYENLGAPTGVANQVQNNQQYLNPWIVQGTLFIPVIATTTANLAGTASMTAQWYIGEGTDFVGEGINNQNSYLVFQRRGMSNAVVSNMYDRKLNKRYGGYIQGQYYFTNQWFTNFVWGMSKSYDVPRSRAADCVSPASNQEGYRIAAPADLVNLWQSFNITLWYRPIQALKFGLQYSYDMTNYFQRTQTAVAAGGGVSAIANPAATAITAPGGPGVTNTGENHRIMFAGFFYF